MPETAHPALAFLAQTAPTERAAADKLARARQEIGLRPPPWKSLSEERRAELTREAVYYLRAAR